MEEEQVQTPKQSKKGNWHDRNYKLLLLIPAVILLFSIVYMGVFYAQNHDFIHKDISLTGGTSVTIYGTFDKTAFQNDLQNKLEDLNIREISDLTTNKQIALIIETTSDEEVTKSVLEEYLGYELTEENSSFEFTGSTLSESFYKQLLIAILVAFVFMALVVFILFRTFVPSGAVVLSAFADILMTLVAFNLFGLKMSTAGIVAMLMLIGYSVDTDILLTNRILKRHEGSLNERILGAFKTGMTMTLTSFFAMLAAFLVIRSFSSVLSQIFTILIIGLLFDMLNTWITNVSILKWYAEKKEGKR